MKQSKPRPKQLSFRAALLLFCLLLATLGVTVGLHARYTTGAVAKDGARVAKFEITETGLGSQENIDVVITADLVPGAIHKKTLTIQNKSEVAVEYTIIVKNLTNNLPLTFSVVAANDSSASVSSMTQDAETGEYTCSAQLQPSEANQNTYELQIIWPENTAENVSTKWVGMVDQVKVSISAIQMD